MVGIGNILEKCLIDPGGILVIQNKLGLNAALSGLKWDMITL